MFIPNTKGERVLQWAVFIAREVFKVMLVTFLMLYVLEDIQPGFVGNFLEFNYFLWGTIGCGFLVIILQNNYTFIALDEAAAARKKSGHLWNGAWALAGAGLVYTRIHDHGIVAVIISLVAGFIIYQLTLYLYSYDDTEEAA
ncbi:MAG: hypothetical protein HZC01_05390 [Candidatus Kerfeldbacteria bacterium]|nr:hypothetical protein [Candidatus Kerfeldbacteria bacterium]